MNKGEACQVEVVTLACGHDAGLWFGTVGQKVDAPVKKLINCRSTNDYAATHRLRQTTSKSTEYKPSYDSSTYDSPSHDKPHASAEHAGGYDSNTDYDDDTHGRVRVLIWVLVPIGCFVGFLILVGIVCAAQHRQNKKRRALHFIAAPARGTYVKSA